MLLKYKIRICLRFGCTPGLFKVRLPRQTVSPKSPVSHVSVVSRDSGDSWRPREVPDVGSEDSARCPAAVAAAAQNGHR
ncbi:hypothetical protein NPIL_211341 [Nephila pilipes]|uniref:Uncharacterized protein n=1 Tax=Nephila pilipes TaxID=299642 RepID=A0A8X6PS81_NEPPI|nr:hypothetical protein NPIL_211341 [Nephila pilipes]